MNLPFELPEFLSLFVVLNETLFPLPLFGIAAGLAVLGLSLAPSTRLRRLGLALLGLLWCGIGVGYHALLLARLTPTAWAFAAGFLVQGGMLLHAAARLEAPRAVAPRARRLGLAILAYAVIGYPVVGLLAGHRFPALPLLGSTPCPTGILTLGVLLLVAPRLPRRLFVIPVVWSGIVLAVALGLGIVEDLGLTAAGVATLVHLVRERRAVAGTATAGSTRGVALLALPLVAGVLLAPAPASAGEPLLVGGAGYLSAGYADLDLGALPDALDDAGFGRPSGGFLDVGGGGHVYLGRLVLGGEGHGLFAAGGEVRRGATRARLGGGYGLGHVGWAVVRSERFVAYPLLGLGGGGMTLSLREGSASSFDEAVARPRGQATLTTGGLLADAGLGAEWRIPFASDDRGQGFLLLGFRAGWTFAPAPGDWQVGDRALEGGPDLGIEGPYVRLVIGAGGIGST